MPDARRLLIAAARGKLAGAAGTLAMDLSGTGALPRPVRD
jgi:hypothetical protein